MTHTGMSTHNNDVEHEIKDEIMPQRKIKTLRDAHMYPYYSHLRAPTTAVHNTHLSVHGSRYSVFTELDPAVATIPATTDAGTRQNWTDGAHPIVA